MSGLPKLAEQNRKEDIVCLLQQGANVNEQDSRQTALHFACGNNYTEFVQILLEQNNINVNLQDDYGWSPFSIACENNRYESVLIMLQDPRVDINMADDYGISPLMNACYFGRAKTIQLLLSFGRKIDIYQESTEDYDDIESGSTALDVAKQENKTDIVQLLQQYQNNPKETQQTTRNELNLKGKK